MICTRSIDSYKKYKKLPNQPKFRFLFHNKSLQQDFFRRTIGILLLMPKNSKLRLLQPEAEGHGKSNLQAGMQSAPGDHQSIVCIGRKSVMLVPFPFRLCFRQEVINENMYTENVFLSRTARIPFFSHGTLLKACILLIIQQSPDGVIARFTVKPQVLLKNLFH